MEAECNHVVNLNIYTYVFIYFFKILYWCPDGGRKLQKQEAVSK